MAEKICPRCNEINETRYQYCWREIMKNCPICDIEFTTICNVRERLTCSKSCSGKFIMQNRHEQNEIRECECCGDEFKPKAYNAKYYLAEKTITCLECSQEFNVICNNDYRFCCTESCSKKYMRKNNYNIAIKECIICGEEYKPTSSAQQVCTREHYTNCEFCKKDFLILAMFNVVGRHKYCSNICSTFAQMNSRINIDLINDYKNINNWAITFTQTNNRLPNAVDIKEYFGFNRCISISNLPNIDLKYFDHNKRYSSLESITEEYIKNNYPKIVYIHNYRHRFNDGKQLEIDFYVPALKIGFEVQDFSTHDKYNDDILSSWGSIKKGPIYHANKSNRYLEIGIKIIEIWQDELFNGDYKSIINKVLK